MHMSYWTNTIPSFRCWLAPVGHTGTHGGSAQCWQPIGRNVRRTSGYSPTSTSTTWRQKTFGGSAFSSWQATVHVWQPTHLRVYGAAGISDDVQLLLLPRVKLGAYTHTNLSAAVLDMDSINETAGFEQTGIIGGNILRFFRVTFDFQRAIVRLELIAGNQSEPTRDANLAPLPLPSVP